MAGRESEKFREYDLWPVDIALNRKYSLVLRNGMLVRGCGSPVRETHESLQKVERIPAAAVHIAEFQTDQSNVRYFPRVSVAEVILLFPVAANLVTVSTGLSGVHDHGRRSIGMGH